jgi:hypothetical protein
MPLLFITWLCSWLVSFIPHAWQAPLMTSLIAEPARFSSTRS